METRTAKIDPPPEARGPAKEAVFSSSEDQIRASQASGPVAESSSVAQNIPLAWAGRAAESLFAVLFPSDCRICSTPLVSISRLPVCQECLDQMLPVHGKVCSICGERVLSAYLLDADDALLCPLCRREPPPFARAAAYGSYDGGLRELIHLLKFNGVRPAVNVLGRMLAEAFAALEPALGSGPIAVVPVPLHKSKRRQRGFNQSELIARAALKLNSANGKLHLAENLLQRQRDTKSQIGLTSHQRRENLRGAFVVASDEASAAQIRGQEVLLMDDVYTTGTTASECTRVLRRAGASRVWVATVARTLKLTSQYAEIRPLEDEEFSPEETPLARAMGS